MDVRRQLENLEVETEPSGWLDDFVTTKQLQPILHSELLNEGVLAVQDEAAGLVVRVLDPQPGERVLDAAAAPGGKATYAAIRMQNTGQVVALDISEAKSRLVKQAAERHGTTIVATVAADLTQWEHAEAFDRVLLDAPCSGTGCSGAQRPAGRASRLLHVFH